MNKILRLNEADVKDAIAKHYDVENTDVVILIETKYSRDDENQIKTTVSRFVVEVEFPFN